MAALTQEVQILLKAVDQFSPIVKKLKTAIESIGSSFDVVEEGLAKVNALASKLETSFEGVGSKGNPVFVGIREALDKISASADKAVAATSKLSDVSAPNKQAAAVVATFDPRTTQNAPASVAPAQVVQPAQPVQARPTQQPQPPAPTVPGGGFRSTLDGLNQLKAGAEAPQAALEKLSNTIRTLAGGFILLQGFQLFKGMADSAAEVERLGTVVRMIGANAGYTAKEIDVADKKIQSLGITAAASRASLTEFIKSGLALDGAAKLARASQDLAVISGENSSDTFRELTTAIGEQSIMMLRWRGISVSNEEAQQKFAATQGRSVSSLNDVEKKQALLNLTLERSSSLSGVYEAAMGDVGKQASSLARYQEEAAVSLEQAMMPAYSNVVTELTIFLRNLRTMTDEFNSTTEGAESFGEGVGAVARSIRKGLEAVVSYRQEITFLAKAYIAFKAAQLGLSLFDKAKTSLVQGVGNLAKGNTWGGAGKEELARNKEAAVVDTARTKATTAHALASTNAQVAITGEYTATSRLAASVNAAALAYERMALARTAALKSPLSSLAGQPQNINRQALPTAPASSQVTKIPTAVSSPAAQTNAAVVASAQARVATPRSPVTPLAASLSAIGNPNAQPDFTRVNKANRLIYDGGDNNGKYVSAGTAPNPRPSAATNALRLAPLVATRAPAPPPAPLATPTVVADGASSVAKGVGAIAPAVSLATRAVGGLSGAFGVAAGLAKGIFALLGGWPGIILTGVIALFTFTDAAKNIGKAFNTVAKAAADIKDTIHGWFTGDKEVKAQLKSQIDEREKAYEKENGKEAKLKTPEAKEYKAAISTQMEAEEKHRYLEYQQGAVKEKLKSSYSVEDNEKALVIEAEIVEAKQAAKVAREEAERLAEEYKDKLDPDTVKTLTSTADKEAFKKGQKNKELIEQTNLLNARKNTGQDQTIYSSGLPVSMEFGKGLNSLRLDADAVSKGLVGVDANVQRVVRAYNSFLTSAKTVEEVIVGQKEWQVLLDDTAERLKVLEQMRSGEAAPAKGASEKEKARFKSVAEEVSKESIQTGVSAADVIAKKLKETKATGEGYTDFGDPAKASKKREEELKASPNKAKAYYDNLVNTKVIGADVAASLDGNLTAQIDVALSHAASLTKEFEKLGATVQSLGKEQAGFLAWQLALDGLTKQTAYFATALDRVRKISEEKASFATSTVSGSEFKGDRTSSVLASIRVQDAKEKYERELALIQQKETKNKNVIAVEKATVEEAARQAPGTALKEKEAEYLKQAKQFKELTKGDREYDPAKEEKLKAEAKAKEEADKKAVETAVHPRYATGQSGTVAPQAPALTFDEKWAKAMGETAGAAAKPKEVPTVTSASGAKETIAALEVQIKDKKTKLINEGKQAEVDLYEKQRVIEDAKKHRKSLSELEPAGKKAAADETIKYLEADYEASKRALTKKRGTASMSDDNRGLAGFAGEGSATGDKAQLDNLMGNLERAKGQKKIDDKYESEVKALKGTLSEQETSALNLAKESADKKLLASDYEGANARVKVSKEYYDALRAQLNDYIAVYKGRMESLRDIHKGQIELTSTLAKQQQGDIIFGEETKFNPRKETIYGAEAEQGRIKIKAEGAKYEEDLSAQSKDEAKQKQLIANGDASPEQKQKMLTQLEAQGVTQRLDINRNYFSQLSSMRDEALAKAKQHAQASVDFEKQARDTILESNKTLRDMNRSDMSEPNKYEDKKREFAEDMARAQEMQKAGDFEGAKAQYRQAQGTARGLQGSDAVDPSSSKRDAMARFSDASQGIAAIQLEQGAIEKAGAASQMATVQNVTEAMSTLSASMQGLAESAEIKLSPKLDEAAIADLQKQLNGVAVDQKLAVEAELKSSGVDRLYDSVQSALDNHAFKLTIDEANITTSKGNQNKTSTTEGGTAPIEKAEGGFIQGIGTGTSDSIPALLSHGEYVVKRDATDHYGTDFLNLLNSRALRFADGGVVEGKRKEGIAGWLLHQKYTAEDVENAKTVKKSVAKEAQPESLLDRALSAETTRRAQMDLAANYSLGGLISRFDSGGDSGELLPGQVMYQGKPTWASQVPSEPKKKSGFFGSLFGKLDSKDEKKPAVESAHVEPAHATGTVLGNKAELNKIASYADGGNVITEAGKYWADDNAEFEKTNPSVWDRTKRALNPMTGFGSAMGTMHDAAGKGDLVGMGIAVAESLPLLGELKYLSLLQKAGPTLSKNILPKLAKNILPKLAHASKPVLDTILGGTAGALAEHGHANEVFADGGEVGLDPGQVLHNGKAVWASQVPRGSNKKEGFFAGLLSKLTSKEEEPKAKDDSGFLGGLLGKSLERDDRRMAHTVAAANYYLGGIAKFSKGAEVVQTEEEKRLAKEAVARGAGTRTMSGKINVSDSTALRQAMADVKPRTDALAAASLYGNSALSNKPSTTQTVTNSAIPNTSKPQTALAAATTPSVLSVDPKESIREKVARGATLTNADLPAKNPKDTSSSLNSVSNYSEVKSSDKWWNKIKSNRRYDEATELWNDYQTARISRENHSSDFGSDRRSGTSNEGSHVSARDLGGMYRTFSEGGLANQALDYVSNYYLGDAVSLSGGSGDKKPVTTPSQMALLAKEEKKRSEGAHPTSTKPNTFTNVAAPSILGETPKESIRAKVARGATLTNADLPPQTEKPVLSSVSGRTFNEARANDKWFEKLRSGRRYEEAVEVWNDYQAARRYRDPTPHGESSPVSASSLGAMYRPFAGGGIAQETGEYWANDNAEFEKTKPGLLQILGRAINPLTGFGSVLGSMHKSAGEGDTVGMALPLVPGTIKGLVAEDLHAKGHFAEGGIAHQTGEYWAKDNEEFEKTHPNPAQQLMRMLNPMTGFGSALGLVHKSAGEGDLLGVGMGALGMMPVLGSAVHGARGAKITFDLLKHMSHHALKDRTKEMVAENVKHQTHASLPVGTILGKASKVVGDIPDIKNMHSAKREYAQGADSSLTDFIESSGGVNKVLSSAYDKDSLKGTRYAQYADGGDVEEKGIAKTTGEYWAHSNEEFEKTHPNPVQQLWRMLNPITGFGSALGLVHKSAGEGDLLGVGMGALGMMPVLGSAVHGARGAKLTVDLLKHMSHHALKDRTKEMVAENVKHQTHVSLPLDGMMAKLRGEDKAFASLKTAPVVAGASGGKFAGLVDSLLPKADTKKAVTPHGDDLDEGYSLKKRQFAGLASGGSIDALLSAFGVGETTKRAAGGMIPALVSHGEFRVNKEAVSHYGSGLFNAINDMSYSRFADGGLAGAASDMLNAENLPNSGQSMTPSEMIELSVKIGEAKASKVQGSRDSIYNLVHSLRDLQDRAMT